MDGKTLVQICKSIPTLITDTKLAKVTDSLNKESIRFCSLEDGHSIAFSNDFSTIDVPYCHHTLFLLNE